VARGRFRVALETERVRLRVQRGSGFRQRTAEGGWSRRSHAPARAYAIGRTRARPPDRRPRRTELRVEDLDVRRATTSPARRARTAATTAGSSSIRGTVHPKPNVCLREIKAERKGNPERACRRARHSAAGHTRQRHVSSRKIEPEDGRHYFASSLTRSVLPAPVFADDGDDRSLPTGSVNDTFRSSTTRDVGVTAERTCSSEQPGCCCNAVAPPDQPAQRRGA